MFCNFLIIKLFDLIRFRDVSLYNPINMAILEKEGCAIADLQNKNRIKRYELRDQIEKHYYFQDIQQEMKNKAILDGKYSYKRYNVIEDRGFDIITLDHLNKTQKENKNLKHNKTEWDKICENSKADLKANISERNMHSTRNVSNTTRGINIILFKKKLNILKIISQFLFRYEQFLHHFI